MQIVGTPPIVRISEGRPISVRLEHLSAEHVENVIELPAKRTAVRNRRSSFTGGSRAWLARLRVGVGSHDQRYSSRSPNIHYTGGKVTVPNIDINGDLG
jgi:hypothetical protein